MTKPKLCDRCGRRGEFKNDVRIIKDQGIRLCHDCHPPIPRSKTCEVCGEKGIRSNPVFFANDVDAHQSCRPARPCKMRGCGEPVHARDMCVGCYNHWYYQQDPEHHRERAKAWSRAHPGIHKVRYWRNPEKRRAYQRRRYQQNRLEGIAIAANSKAKRVGSKGRLTAEGLQARIDLFGGKCWMCGDDADAIDHVIPFSRGGPNLHANIRPACTSCNSKKGTKILHATG